MKNSLFKRAMAAVAAVPLALTQCLTYTSSYAVTNENPLADDTNVPSETGKTSYTLRGEVGLLYIAPDQIESTWYDAVYSELVLIGQKNTSGYIKKETIENAILSRAGKYDGKAETLLTLLSDEDIVYTVSGNGDITITGKTVNPDLSELTSTFNIPMDDTLKELADKYGAPEIKDIDFSSVDFSGTVEILVQTSQLKDSQGKADVKAKYIANNNGNKKEIAVGNLPDFALEKIEEMKSIAHASIADSVPDATMAKEAMDEFDSQLEKYEKWLNKANNNKDKIMSANRQESAENIPSLIKALNNFADNNKYVDKVDDKLNKEYRIPATVADIVKNSIIATVYDEALKQLNSSLVSYEVDIASSEIASFADNDLSKINASAENGTYILTGDFPDDEVPESTKHLKATVEIGDIYDANSVVANVGLDIWRDVVTTTTTTTFTTTTETTTTTTDTTTTPENVETSTSTTPENVETSTSTTPAEDDGTTTSTTPAEDDGTTTSTTPAEDDGTTTSTTPAEDDGTTTSTTPVEDDGTTTSTTPAEDDGTSTTTTTMSGYVRSYAEYDTTTMTDGFYFSHDDGTYGGFHAEQIDLDSIKIFDVYDVDGEEVPVERADLDVDKFNFNGETPNSKYTKANTSFKYNVQLYYDDIALVDKDGYDVAITAYIGVKGDINLDNTADSVDASQALVYYSVLSTDGTADTTALSLSDKVNYDPMSVYDNFAAFLGDVDANEFAPDNWKTGKKGNGRSVDTVDAVQISQFYSLIQTDYKDRTQEAWDVASPSRRG